MCVCVFVCVCVCVCVLGGGRVDILSENAGPSSATCVCFNVAMYSCEKPCAQHAGRVGLVQWR